MLLSEAGGDSHHDGESEKPPEPEGPSGFSTRDDSHPGSMCQMTSGTPHESEHGDHDQDDHDDADDPDPSDGCEHVSSSFWLVSEAYPLWPTVETYVHR